MTPEDLILDPQNVFNSSPITLYRLAKTRFANLSGAGAAISPGRWNLLGEEAIYTSINVALPQLEKLVHTRKDLIPSNLARMKIRLAGEWRRDKYAEDEWNDLFGMQTSEF